MGRPRISWNRLFFFDDFGDLLLNGVARIDVLGVELNGKGQRKFGFGVLFLVELD